MLESMDAQSDRDGNLRSTTTEFRPGVLVTEAEQASRSQADEERVMAQAAAREKRDGGTGEMAGVVLGSSSTEFRQKQRYTLNRLNQGAWVFTVFHEETHGFFREALASLRSQH